MYVATCRNHMWSGYTKICNFIKSYTSAYMWLKCAAAVSATIAINFLFISADKLLMINCSIAAQLAIQPVLELHM